MKSKKVRRVVLGIGYLAYDIRGLAVSIIVNGKEGAFDLRQIDLKRPEKASDHNKVRLVAEVLE